MHLETWKIVRNAHLHGNQNLTNRRQKLTVLNTTDILTKKTSENAPNANTLNDALAAGNARDKEDAEDLRPPITPPAPPPPPWPLLLEHPPSCCPAPPIPPMLMPSFPLLFNNCPNCSCLSSPE
jgi:hypothetical protein